MRCRTAERLAEFHRVENTYLSTFQTLGGLGLLLGTIGLAAVLLRNVLERRRELALLGAVGYGRGRLFAIVVAESTLLLACGPGGRRGRARSSRSRPPPPIAAAACRPAPAAGCCCSPCSGPAWWRRSSRPGPPCIAAAGCVEGGVGEGLRA